MIKGTTDEINETVDIKVTVIHNRRINDTAKV
jgi:hypothetical protein